MAAGSGLREARGVGLHGWPRRSFNQTPYRGGGSGSGRPRARSTAHHRRPPPLSAPPSRPSPCGAHPRPTFRQPHHTPTPPAFTANKSAHCRRANRRRRQRLPLSPPARLRRRSGSPPAHPFSRMRVPSPNAPPRTFLTPPLPPPPPTSPPCASPLRARERRACPLRRGNRFHVRHPRPRRVPWLPAGCLWSGGKASTNRPTPPLPLSLLARSPATHPEPAESRHTPRGCTYIHGA